MSDLTVSLVGFLAGVLVAAIVRLTRLEERETESYQRGYASAVRDRQARDKERARKAAQTRRRNSAE